MTADQLPLTLTTALIAGGQSSRFGSDKALALYQGQPLWQWQWEKLQALPSESQVLSLREPRSWVPSEMAIVYDQSTPAGPLAAFAALLSEIRTTHLLVLAVDLPAMTAPYLANLWSQVRKGEGVVPSLDGWYQGLCAIYPRECAPLASVCLRSEDVSMQHFVRASLEMQYLRTVEVKSIEGGFFQNWNTPA